MERIYIVTDGSLTLQLEAAEEGGFTVSSPFVPGLVTEAESLEQAFEMARACIADLEAAAKKPIRKPTKKRSR